jgi:hypothetical protein
MDIGFQRSGYRNTNRESDNGGKAREVCGVALNEKVIKKIRLLGRVKPL